MRRPSLWSLAVGALAMLGSLTAIAAVVVADVSRAEQQQRSEPLSDALPEAEPPVFKKVLVKKKVEPRPVHEVLTIVNMGRFEGY